MEQQKFLSYIFYPFLGPGALVFKKKLSTALIILGRHKNPRSKHMKYEEINIVWETCWMFHPLVFLKSVEFL